MTEQQELELTTETMDVESEEMLQIQEHLQNEAMRKTKRHLKTHGREIKRLKNLAYKALLTKNFDSYSYAILKLRGIYKQQPLPHSAMVDMYKTSLDQIAKLFTA